MNRGKPVYSFPELKPSEITQCMADLRVPFSEHDLQKPTPMAVQRVFESFVEIFMGPKALSSIPGTHSTAAMSDGTVDAAAALQVLEYPEIHLDSVALLAFYRTCARLMWHVGVEDFSLKDLIRPECPRLRILLSAIINFAKFREEQLGVWEELTRRGEEAEAERERLAAREADLRARIAAIRQQREHEEPRVHSVKEQIGALVNELRELKKQQTQLAAEIDSRKERRQGLTDTHSRLQYLLSSGRQECAKLKSRIVHSPEKLLQILAEMNASINTERQSLSALEKRSRELQTRFECLQKIENDLRRCIQQLDQNDQTWRRVEEVQKSVQVYQDRQQQQRVAIDELAVRQQQLKRQLAVAQERLGKLTGQQEAKRVDIAQRLDCLRRDYAGLSEERAALAAKMDDTDRLVKDMEAKVCPCV